MRDDRGAVYLMAIPMVCLLIGMVWYVKAIGDVIIDREALQDAADSGALSAAIMHARGMNMIALVNQVMAALVAVLVTLKMFETLMLLAQGLAVLLSVPTYGASMSVVPPAKTAENASKSAYEALKGIITPAVQGLHYFELGLKYSMPGAAQLRVIESVEHFTPPAAFGFAIPGAYPLPVEKGTWSDLCEKAGEHAGRMIAMPIDATIPIADVGAPLSAAGGALAGTFSSYFCVTGEGGSGGGIQIPSELPPIDLQEAFDASFPPQANSLACRDEAVQGAGALGGELAEGLGGGLTESAHKQLCEEASHDEAMAQVNDQGLPFGGSDVLSDEECWYSVLEAYEEVQERRCEGPCLQPDGTACDQFMHRVNQSHEDCHYSKKQEIKEWTYQKAELQWTLNLVPVPPVRDPQGNIQTPVDGQRRFLLEAVTEEPEMVGEFVKVDGALPCGPNPNGGAVGQGYNKNATYRAGGYRFDDYLCTSDNWYPDVRELNAQSPNGLTRDEWWQTFSGQRGWTTSEEAYDFEEPETYREQREVPVVNDRGEVVGTRRTPGELRVRQRNRTIDRLVFEGRWTAVTYVVGCKKSISDISQVEFEAPEPDEFLSADSLKQKDECGEGDMVHHQMKPGLVLGSETFQQRAVVVRGSREDSARKVVETLPYRLRGQQNAGSSTFASAASFASQVFVAQAEYFFDAEWDYEKNEVKTLAEDWVWEAKWKARMRRFRLPRDEEPGGQQQEDEKPGGKCEFGEDPPRNTSESCNDAVAAKEEGSGVSPGGSGLSCPSGDFLGDLQGIAEALIVH